MIYLVTYDTANDTVQLTKLVKTEASKEAFSSILPMKDKFSSIAKRRKFIHIYKICDLLITSLKISHYK